MKFILKNRIHFFLIPLVCLMIIFFWFKEGRIISNTTEEELSIYHSQRTAVIYASFWNPTSVGQTNPFAIARFPVFFTLGLLEQVGMPAFLNQALLFWALMVIGVSSMFLLLRKCFLVSSRFSLIGGLFYLLNLYSMTQIWKRMLYHGMFAWAYLPLFIFLWIKWMDSKRKRWLFLFLLTSVFFAYSFSQPAFIITIWTPAVIFALVQAWQSKFKIRELTRIFSRALTGLLFWGLVNIWWLYPMLTLGSTWTQITGQTLKSDLSSLHAVSKSFPIGEVLLLRQSWYFSPENDFGSFYQNPLIILISVLIFFFVILAIVKLKDYPYRGFVCISALIGLFICKGTSFPLGYIFFYLLFLILPFSAAFRNSYEKFGIVWLLAYTILFTLGFSKFISALKPNRRYWIGGTILVLISILVFPFWSGGMFPQKHKISVPEYYEIANRYLNERSEDRLFHIPFVLELENSTYSWGFVGGDPSHVLFDLEPITKPKVPVYYQVADLLPKYLNDKDFPKILGALGVGNVVVHKDIVYPKIDLAETIKQIENWNGIYDKKEIGELVIYSLNKDLVNPRVYTAKIIVSAKSIDEGLMQLISEQFDTKNSVFVVGNNSAKLDSLSQDALQISIKRISNDHYLTEIKNVTEPYILVLNNTFDKLWQAKIGNYRIGQHFIVNGFANGWLVEKTGDYKVDIRLKVWPWD